MNIAKYKSIIGLVLILACGYFAFFYHLTSHPLLLWDEARCAVNAYEWLHGQQPWYITTYDWKTDLWNTKPPLFPMLIALSIKLFGTNLLALRLVSALSGLGTAFLVYFFAKKITDSTWTSVAAAFILMTSVGYVGFHISRTADYDALLTFFSTAFAFAIFLFLESKEKLIKIKYLALAAVLFLLAFFTKSSAALFGIPGIVLYLICTKKLIETIRNKYVWLFILLIMLLIGAYFIVRENYTPGFFQIIMKNELGGRYLTTIEDHLHPWSFYLLNFLNERFIPWIYLLPVCAAIVLLNQSDKAIRVSVFCLLILSTELILISGSATKLYWYDASIYPFASIIIGIGLNQLGGVYFDSLKNMSKRKEIFSVIFLLLIFIFPLRQLIGYAQDAPNHQLRNNHVEFGNYIQAVFKKFSQINSVTAIDEDYNPHLTYYREIFADKGKTVSIVNPMDSTLKENSFIVCCDSSDEQRIHKNYEIELLDSGKHCKTFRIKKALR